MKKKAKMKNDRIKVPEWAFYLISARDAWTCHVCGCGYIANDPWEIDHDVPLAKGGTNHIKNLRLTHRTCNRDKATA